ncbi:MAG: ankyrin repeat domain-containing protein [Tatlockia sp.]|jgi:ankyrin repeat protein
MLVLKEIPEDGITLLEFAGYSGPVLICKSALLGTPALDYLCMQTLINKNYVKTLAALASFSDEELAPYKLGEVFNKSFVFAAKINNIEILKILRPKVNIDFMEDGASAVTFAVKKQNAAMLQYLIEEKANLCGRDALHEAADADNCAIAALLIHAGVDVNEQKKFTKITPLHTAAERGYLPMVKLLLENNAKVLSDFDNRTPVDWASSKEIKQVLKDTQIQQCLSLEERQNVLTKLTADKKLDPAVCLSYLANFNVSSEEQTVEWINEANQFAEQERSPFITERHFILAHVYITKRIACTDSPKESNTESKHWSAVHEAGHALIIHKGGTPLHYLAINHSGRGFTFFRRPEGNLSHRLQIALGGVVAEKVVNHSSIGSDSNLLKARKYAKKIMLEHSNANRDEIEIEDEIKNIIEKNEAQVLDILSKNKDKLIHVGDALEASNCLSRQNFLDLIEDVTEHKPFSI